MKFMHRTEGGVVMFPTQGVRSWLHHGYMIRNVSEMALDGSGGMPQACIGCQ